MSHTQHTPGPWTVEIDRWHYDTASTVVAGAERPTFPFRELLVQVGGTDLGRQEANTRLIAAAPELYEACELMMTEGCLDEAIRKAVSVLAKVRGSA